MPTEDLKNKKTKDGYSELLIWNVPERLKRKFKAKCAEKKITLQDAVIDLMKNFCK